MDTPSSPSSVTGSTGATGSTDSTGSNGSSGTTVQTNYNNTICSFCGYIGHDIRSCESPEILNIEQSFAQLYVDNLCESTYLQLNSIQTEEFFVYKMTTRYLLRHIRVVAVTTGLARASGFTKADYATLIYRLYTQMFITIASGNYVPNNDSESNSNNIASYVRNLIDEFNLAAENAININAINANNVSTKFNISLILDFTQSTSSITDCECGICLEHNIEKKNMVSLNCKHSFCCNCVVRVLEMTSPSKTPCCAFCRASITDIETSSSDNYTRLAEFCNI